MKHITIFVILFSVFQTISAQNILSGSVNGLLKNTPVYLSEYYGGKPYPSDTVFSDIYGSFHFDLSNKATGMLQLRYLNQTFNFVYNNENIVFATQLTTPVDSFKILQSEENKMYHNFLIEKEKSNTVMQMLYPLVNDYPKNDALYQAILERFQQAKTEYENLVQNYRNNELLASKIITWQQIPQPESNLSQFENIAFYREHLFDNIDFSSPYLLRTDILNNFFAMYLSFYTTANNMEQIKTDYRTATDNILKITKVNNEVYIYTIMFLMKEFEKYGHPDISDYVLNKANFEENSCMDEKTQLIEEHLQALRRTAIGQTAPDISAPNVENVTVKLSDIKADYKLVVFWASWCPHCKTLLPQLEQAYKDYNRRGLEIITLSLDTEPQAWQAELKGDRQKWTNLCEQKGWDSQAAQQYGIYATPTMFLLNAQNQIIAKPNTTQDLSKYLAK